MRIIKDGSVFRLALESGCNGPETRISYAVNSHGDMRRPRVEFAQREFAATCAEMLGHMSAADLFGDKDQASTVRQDTLFRMLRILQELGAAVLREDEDGAMSQAINGKTHDMFPEMSGMFAHLAKKPWC